MAHTICFTCFQFDDDADTWLKKTSRYCDWIFGQVEECPETGKKHIQGMAHSKSQCRWGFLKCFKEKCIDPVASIAYCSKSETRIDGPFEYGLRPTWNIKGAKRSNLEIIHGDLKEMVDNDEIHLYALPKVMKAIDLYKNLKPIVKEEKKIKGFWHYGPPRTGKSTAARQGNFYLKGCNKWWDGYTGQPIVVLEDVDISSKDWLGHYLKIWTDWWEFRAEIKGGSMVIQIQEFHVTSNYSIEEIFGCDKSILSRFNIIKYE